MSLELAVAIAAAVAAAIALGAFAWLWVRVRRLRDAQRVLLGGGRSDLVEFAVSLQGRIDDLHRAVDEIAAGLSRVDRRVDGSLTNTAVIRYDAYAGTGGHQSASFAFLDSNRTGTVVTAIQGRDYARLYVKEVERGKAPIALSPEELEAVERAMARYSRKRPARWYSPVELQQVLVLNASYEPLNVCSVRRAHVLVWKGKAEIIESLPKGLRSATDTFVWPHVIRLVQYVRVPRAIQRKISRRALFARDGWRCVYCGASSGRLTLDHVVPRSRGGESIWENVVTACAPCNLRKGDRLLEESGLHLKRLPRAPAPVLFIHLATPTIPQVWQQYLPGSATAA